MAKYEISDSVKNNILVFLDRIAFQGMKEVNAINEIIACLAYPIDELVENQENKK